MGAPAGSPSACPRTPCSAAQKNSAQNVNAAMRAGAKVETMKKFGGANQSGASKNAAKLDAQTEAGRLNTVSSDMRKVIQQGRQAKKWSQTQLANAINQPPKTVQEYENGKAVPNPRSSQRSSARSASSSRE